MNAVKEAASRGIQVNVIGVGSATPVTIPENGGLMIDDQTGQPVRTALDEKLAADIAAKGKGIYVNASAPDALNDLESQLSTLKKTTLQSSSYSKHDELFYIFAIIALVCVVFDILLLDTKISWLDKFTFFKKEDKK